MSKYRVVKKIDGFGNCMFVVQKKFLFWWTDCYDNGWSILGRRLQSVWYDDAVKLMENHIKQQQPEITEVL